MFADPVSFLIGFGPDSLLSHFSTFRSQIVNSYFPSDMLIDSSHNIVIDIFFQYGALPLILIGFFLYRYFNNQKEELQFAILLGGVFLLLNVFVIVHIVVISLIMRMGAD
jgi:O-antigen ligase